MEGWLLGVLLTIISAAGSTTGLILQKMAHVKEEENRNIQNISNVDEVVENITTTELQDNNDNDVKKCFGMPCNKYFIAGFIMLVFVPLPFDFIALANAGQSIILPVGTGCTVIFGQILAPKVLNESLTRLDIVATFLITIGVFISTLTGTHKSPVYTSNELLRLYTLPPIIITIIFIIVTTTICILFTHYETIIINQCIKRNIQFPESLKIPILAYIPSALGALQIMVFKMVGELTKNTFEGYDETYIEKEMVNTTTIQITKTRKVHVNEFANPLLWICLLFVITLAIGQLSYLNRGLAKYNAIKFLPTYNTLLLMVGVTCGAIYFQEYNAFHPVFFPIGVLFEMSGILALSWKSKDDAEKEHDEKKKRDNNKTKKDGITYGSSSSSDEDEEEGMKDASKNGNMKKNASSSPLQSIKRMIPRSHEKIYPATTTTDNIINNIKNKKKINEDNNNHLLEKEEDDDGYDAVIVKKESKETI